MAFSAEVGGNIVTTGGLAPDVKIYYGTSDGETTPGNWDTNAYLDVHPEGAVSADLTDLDEFTTYHYRFRAENATDGSVWADPADTFRTKATIPVASVADTASIEGDTGDRVFLLHSSNTDGMSLRP